MPYGGVLLEGELAAARSRRPLGRVGDPSRLAGARAILATGPRTESLERVQRPSRHLQLAIAAACIPTCAIAARATIPARQGNAISRRPWILAARATDTYTQGDMMKEPLFQDTQRNKPTRKPAQQIPGASRSFSHPSERLLHAGKK